MGGDENSTFQIYRRAGRWGKQKKSEAGMAHGQKRESYQCTIHPPSIHPSTLVHWWVLLLHSGPNSGHFLTNVIFCGFLELHSSLQLWSLSHKCHLFVAFQVFFPFPTPSLRRRRNPLSLSLSLSLRLLVGNQRTHFRFIFLKTICAFYYRYFDARLTRF